MKGFFRPEKCCETVKTVVSIAFIPRGLRRLDDSLGGLPKPFRSFSQVPLQNGSEIIFEYEYTDLFCNRDQENKATEVAI